MFEQKDRKANKAFEFVGGTNARIGILLIHGFTGSPAELRPLGLHLAQQGYTVLCPLLSRHGSLPSELRGAKWQDWLHETQSALENLQKKCDYVVVAGLSMGGLLAIQLSAHSRHISGIVLMGTPVALRNRFAGLARFAKYIIPSFGPLDRANFNQPHIQNFVLRQTPPGTHVDFKDPKVIASIRKQTKIPLDAIDQLLSVNKASNRVLHKVSVPALVVQGRRDHVIKPESAHVIINKLGSAHKQLIWLENSAHTLPLEPDKEQLFAEVAKFIQQVTIVAK
jgi:carboxylesterase